MRLLVFNGPNIKVLDKRNSELYGGKSYKEMVSLIKNHAKKRSIKINFYESNSEGKLISFIQKNLDKYDGWIVNLGAYSHYSYAIRDALELLNKKIVEVHITDINSREDFRKTSVIEDLSSYRIIGKGIEGYLLAIDWLKENT